MRAASVAGDGFGGAGAGWAQGGGSPDYDPGQNGAWDTRFLGFMKYLPW